MKCGAAARSVATPCPVISDSPRDRPALFTHGEFLANCYVKKFFRARSPHGSPSREAEHAREEGDAGPVDRRSADRARHVAARLRRTRARRNPGRERGEPQSRGGTANHVIVNDPALRSRANSRGRIRLTRRAARDVNAADGRAVTQLCPFDPSPDGPPDLPPPARSYAGGDRTLSGSWVTSIAQDSGFARVRGGDVYDQGAGTGVVTGASVTDVCGSVSPEGARAGCAATARWPVRTRVRDQARCGLPMGRAMKKVVRWMPRSARVGRFGSTRAKHSIPRAVRAIPRATDQAARGWADR